MAALALFIPWLGHLFYPWGFILQILALVHLVRRRGEYYWFFIILAGGMIGALAYMVMEVLPDARLLGQAYARHGRKARIRAVETAILDNPSPANYEELGELWLDQQEYARAREAFNRSIAARGDSVYAYYRRALSALALEDYAGAAPDLEHVIRSDPRFDSHRAAALLAHAYAKTGNGEGAEAWFAEVTQHSTALETLYNYACFLKSQNRREEARAWAQRMLEKKRTLPRYMQRIERPWFRKAQALLKELAPP
jgi:hypothetical protein